MRPIHYYAVRTIFQSSGKELRERQYDRKERGREKEKAASSPSFDLLQAFLFVSNLSVMTKARSLMLLLEVYDIAYFIAWTKLCMLYIFAFFLKYSQSFT